MSIAPEAKQYVSRFVTTGASLGRHIVIDDLIVEFKAITPKWMGVCYYGQTPRIVLNTYYWQWLNDLDREQLVFHELGHCVLNRDHNDQWITAPDGNYIQASVMNAYDFEWWKYDLYHDFYMRELFLGVYQF